MPFDFYSFNYKASDVFPFESCVKYPFCASNTITNCPPICNQSFKLVSKLAKKMLNMYSKTAANCIIFHQYGNYSLSGGMYIQYIPFCIPRTAMHHMGNFQDENSFENTPLNHNIHTTVFPWCKLDLINLLF